MLRTWFSAGAVAVLGLGLLVPTPLNGQRRPLTMLESLADGRWELKIRGERMVHRLCVHDGRELVQLRHASFACDKTIIEDAADSVTVQYTCRGQGYGRTRIRRETPALVQVESQGVADGLPFDFAAEGRRVGDCTP